MIEIFSWEVYKIFNNDNPIGPGGGLLTMNEIFEWHFTS